MQLQHLIDRMIDQADESDPEGSDTILIGAAPSSAKRWTSGKRVYRWCPVNESRLVPNDLVVLAPSPDNLRHSDLVEYHGGLRDGQITRHTIRRRAADGDDDDADDGADDDMPSQRP
jgi:hypothetical protein